MTKKYEVGPDGVLTDVALADILDIAINEKKSMLASRRDIAATQHELDQAHEAEAVKTERKQVLAEVREKTGTLINPYPNPFVFASGRQAIMDILDKMAKG